MPKLTQFTAKSNEELKELLETLSKQSQSDEVKLICYILKKHLDAEI